jgi:hypothetical protein
MNRLTAGLGWAQSEWNGPQHETDLQNVLKGRSFIEYAFTEYGLPNISSAELDAALGVTTGPTVPDVVDTSPGLGEEPTQP